MYKNNYLKKKLEGTLYYILLLFLYPISMLPIGLLTALFSRPIYFITYNVIRYRYNVVLQNLSRSFPYKRYAEINETARGFYKEFSVLIAELIKLFSISRTRSLNLIQVENPELLLQYHLTGRNMIAILGHYGNWECLNILPHIFPFPVNALYKPIKNQLMDRVVKNVRTRFGMQLIPSNQALRYLLKNAQRSQLTLFVADQYPGNVNGKQMLFLNQATQTFDGAEKLD